MVFLYKLHATYKVTSVIFNVWVDNVGTINSVICCSGASYQQARWRSYNFHKGQAKRTQHFNATSYNIARSRWGMLWRSWPNACNILQHRKCCYIAKAWFNTIQHLAHFSTGWPNVPNVCNVVIYKTEKNWWRRLRLSAALSSHLTPLHTTMHIISKSQYALTMVQLNIFVLIHQTIKFQTKLINGTRKANW